jgi:leader peptidase (prepilin peptidase)/N-methyltransferase
VEIGAAATFLLAGLVVGPVADRLATNAPGRRPLLSRTRRSRALPLVVAGTALSGAGCGLAFGLTAEAAIASFFCWVLVVVTRTDLETRLIPDRIVLPSTLVVLVARTLDDPSVSWFASALAAGVALFLVALVYPRGLGMGDVKLAAFLGAGLGSTVVVALFLGFFAAFVPALVLVLRHGRGAGKLAIPLGPFLALGAVIALFAGGSIFDWYTSLST